MSRGWSRGLPWGTLALLGGLLSAACADNVQPGPRAVVLRRAPNTRGLGGLPLAGGKVRQGLVWRSGALGNVTTEDLESLRQLGLRSVLDFRLKAEICPENTPDAPALKERLNHFYALPMSPNRDVHRQGWYKAILVDNTESFKQAFLDLAERDNYPLLYHCAKGKDRTGVVTALLLEVLGASETTIEDDYLESERQAGRHYRTRSEWLLGLREYVRSRGGAEAYLQSIGVDAEHCRRLRDILVERL